MRAAAARKGPRTHEGLACPLEAPEVGGHRVVFPETVDAICEGGARGRWKQACELTGGSRLASLQPRERRALPAPSFGSRARENGASSSTTGTAGPAVAAALGASGAGSDLVGEGEEEAFSAGAAGVADAAEGVGGRVFARCAGTDRS